MLRKKIEDITIKAINLQLRNENTALISIPPCHYDNFYLWTTILENILIEIAYKRHTTLVFNDDKLYNIFVDLLEKALISSFNESKLSIFFNSCNKRIITELMNSYNFFDYSRALFINIEDEYCITPLGDNLGIEIKCSNGINNIISIVEKVCCDYSVILERIE